MSSESIEKDNRAGTAIAIWIVAFLLIVVLIVVLALTVQNNQDQNQILEESIKQELVASSIAARELIDPDLLINLNGPEDIAQNQNAYDQVIFDLRTLRTEIGATYIYVLKLIDDQYYFVFDTDEESADIFGAPYQLSEVHWNAFRGDTDASVLDVVDEWGSFNTGAAPIFKDGLIIGIVSTDIEDAYLQRSIDSANFHTAVLVITLVLILTILLIVIALMLRRVSKIQKNLFKTANFDNITKLPNRYYLFKYLDSSNRDMEKSKTPYAMLFIDLDNFKSVNDGAGHDAGDVLLRNIALFLEKCGSLANKTYPNTGSNSLTARIGGDEFLQIIPGITNQNEAAAFVQKMLDDFCQEDQLQSFIEDFSVGMSIGISLFPKHSTDYNELIKFSDIAMYHAKAAGKNRYTVYTPEMAENEQQFELIVRSSRS